MQLYVDAQNGTDTAGQGTSWATAYATPDFAMEDLWTSHGRDTTTDVNGDVINCVGTFTFSTSMQVVTSPLAGISRRVTFLSRGLSSVDDGQRCLWKADNGIWNSSTQEYIGFVGFKFRWNLTSTSEKGLRVDRACWFYDCEWDGRDAASISSATQFHWNNQVINCRFINMSSSIGNMSIGGQMIGNYVETTAGYSSISLNSYRNGIITGNTVIIDHQDAGSGFGSIVATSGCQVYGNTVINRGIKGTGSYGIQGQSEGVIIANNYVENATSVIALTSAANWFYSDNYYYDCTYGQTSSGGQNWGGQAGVIELDSSLYTDPPNDWTIANPEAIARRTTTYGGLEYWGGVQQIQPQKNGYNPFGEV